MATSLSYPDGVPNMPPFTPAPTVTPICPPKVASSKEDPAEKVPQPKLHESISMNGWSTRDHNWQAYENPSFFGLDATGRRWRWLRVWTKLRSKIVYPLQYRLLGKRVTVGELFIVLPLVVVYLVLCGLALRDVSTPIVNDNDSDGKQRVFQVLEDGKAESSATIATIPMLLVYMTVSHNSIWTFLLGIPFERTLLYHKLIACLIWPGMVIHGVLSFIDISWNWNDLEGEHVTGLIIMGAVAGLFMFSIPPIRRKFFEFFWITHLVLMLVALVCSVMHGAGIVLLGFALWGVDCAWRYIVLACFKLPREVVLTQLPADVIRVQWRKPKGWNYQPGQYVFMCLPKISLYQWHPFSISSSPGQEDVMIHIRVLGNWTKALHKFSADVDGRGSVTTKALIEGPYGAPMVDLEGDRYKCVLLISGGIGITPLQSICNDLIDQVKHGRDIKKIWFVWSCADKYLINSVLQHDRDVLARTFSSRLPLSFQPDLMETVDCRVDYLQTDFYLTRCRTEADFEEANIHPEFQPNLKFGRPNLAEIFTQMADFAGSAGEKKVAVLTCGPKGLVKDVRKSCAMYSSHGVGFDFHAEEFEF